MQRKGRNSRASERIPLKFCIFRNKGQILSMFKIVFIRETISFPGFRVGFPEASYYKVPRKPWNEIGSRKKINYLKKKILEEGCTFKFTFFLLGLCNCRRQKKTGRIDSKLWPSSNIATLIATWVKYVMVQH